MTKQALKRKISKEQERQCALSGKILPEDTSLFDTDRRKPKKEGGKYTAKNTRVVNPIAHMKRHNNLRHREQDMENLKAVIDEREQRRKLYNKINNQLLAYTRRTDHLNEETVQWLNEQKDHFKEALNKYDKLLKKAVEKMVDNPLVSSALGVKGIGPITIAYCLIYIDLEKARHASSLWAYAGLDKPSHERYTKGKSSGGNKNLRTVLYTMADSQMKTRGAYREVYDRVKSRLEVSDKIVKSRDTKGALIEMAWKDTKPCHRHGAALRAVMKHFLADYWFVGRTLQGLPTQPLYAEAILGKDGHKTVSPKERGWKFNGEVS